MEEKLTEIALCEINKGIEFVNTAEMGAVIDMIKDLACAEKEAREAKEMEKEEEDEKKENEHFLKMLKEEYGEDEGERRFYDNYRYANGRFAPKGKGSYRPRSKRRGYEESIIPLDYQMNPEDYKKYPPEYWRDMDRLTKGVMYYTQTGSDANINGRTTWSSDGTSSGNTSENSASTGGYSDGFDEGKRRGYSEGYEQGSRDGESRGRSQGGNSRYERAKRGYEETKEKHKGNTPEDKQLTMREAEKVLNVVFDELDEMLQDAPPEMKNMVKTKGMTRFQKIQ